MIKRIISFIILIGVCGWLLRLGGYNWQGFKNAVHLRDPKEVLAPLPDYLPDLPEVSSMSFEQRQENILTTPAKEDKPKVTTYVSNDFVDENGNIKNPNAVNAQEPEETKNTEITIEEPSEAVTTTVTSNVVDIQNTTKATKPKISSDEVLAKLEEIKKLIFSIDGKSFELSSDNAASFVKWLSENWSKDSEMSYEKVEDEDQSNNSEATTSSTLANGESLQELISSINTVSSLTDDKTYDRNTFEKPVKSYTLDGKKVNRNDYAWKTSPYFNEENFTYTCPYTGKVFTDLDDGKDDKDFGNLDYDHIVPLKSAYLRGAQNWTVEQMNEYAYDQSVGVDVLNSANRSKADKGPAEWLPDVNRGSYCYSWLVICQKYNLSMTEEEIKICNDEITKALANGEKVEFMGGQYNG